MTASVLGIAGSPRRGGNKLEDIDQKQLALIKAAYTAGFDAVKTLP